MAYNERLIPSPILGGPIFTMDSEGIMVLRFYDIIGTEFITEIPSDTVPPNGQRLHLPDSGDEIYIVVDSVIDYRRHGNNFPTCTYVTVAREDSIKGIWQP